MSEQAYKSAIDIIAKGDVDYKDIAIKLAKENPELFCKFVGSSLPLTDPYAFAHDLYYNKYRGNNNYFIAVIKAVREKFGHGLREAKDLVDEVRYKPRW